MANYCYYTAKAIGSKEAVEEFARILARENEFTNSGIGSATDFEWEPAEKTHAKGIWTIEGQGSCGWSIVSGMMEEGSSDRYPVRTLESETERLHIAVELYSSEPSIGFQEHVVIVNGQVMENQCVEYEEYFLENGLNDLASFNEKHGTACTERDINHNGEICFGGFGERFGDFKEIFLMTYDYLLLRDKSSLFRGEVEISKQADDSVAFVFGDTRISGIISFLEGGSSFALKELSGEQIAFGKKGELSARILRLYGMEIAKHVPVDEVWAALSQDHDRRLGEAIESTKSRAIEKNAKPSNSLSNQKVSNRER